MTTRDIAKRRKVRALEARRDKLMENTERNKVELKKVRAELKAIRGRRRATSA